jgi:hypothetical protein
MPNGGARSGGIKLEYALKIFFCRDNISVFYFGFLFFASGLLLFFNLRMLFALRPMQSWQIRNRLERVFLSTYAPCRKLCDLGK